MQGDIDQIHMEESWLCLNNKNSPTTASNISSEPSSVLARVEARPTPKHPMEGFLPVSLPAVQGNSLSASAARALSSPTPEVLRAAERAPGSASHSRHSPKATETPLLPQSEQSPELHKEGWIQSPANYPIYSQWAAAMEKGALSTDTTEFRNNWIFYIPWNDAQSCYSMTPSPCFVPSRSKCKPEICFVYRRHLQN